MTWSGFLTWTGLFFTGLFIALKLAEVGAVPAWTWWAVLLLWKLCLLMQYRWGRP
jgi:hypothetical protein